VRHITHVNDVERMVRARICARCPYRTAGTDQCGTDSARPCEAGRELFSHLHVLTTAARQLDPMVGHRPKVLRRLVRRIGARPGATDTVRRFGGRVVALLEELFH
jgi:hypothetical protein